MGSPYSVARVQLSGDFMPDFDGDFQDVGLVTDDGRTCYLVEWRIEDSVPGFSVWRLSEDEREVRKSTRITGCCVGLSVDGGTVQATSWDDSVGQRVVTVRF